MCEEGRFVDNFTAKCFGAVAVDVSLYSNLTFTGLGVVFQKA